MAHKLDIFETLNAIDSKNMDFLENLTDEERKGFAPPVVLRWASAVADGKLSDHYLLLINERANLHFWDLYEHPELQFKLMASCGSGRSVKHQWIPMANFKRKADKVREFLGEYWPDANNFELDILLNQFTDETFKDFVLYSGCSPEESKEVMDAYGKFRKTKI